MDQDLAKGDFFLRMMAAEVRDGNTDLVCADVHGRPFALRLPGEKMIESRGRWATWLESLAMNPPTEFEVRADRTREEAVLGRPFRLTVRTHPPKRTGTVIRIEGVALNDVNIELLKDAIEGIISADHREYVIVHVFP